MSGAQGSEEKTLPPSDAKLRDARKKGQIAKSSDAVAATSMILLTLYLLFAWPSIKQQFGQMFQIADGAMARGGLLSLEAAIKEIAYGIGEIVLPFLLIGVAATVLGAVISNKGLIFSAHPLKPDLNRINPAAGFKRIFSVRNVVESIKALIKSLLLLGALGVSAWYGLAGLLRIPYCGANCVGEAFAAVVGPLVVSALLLFLFAALIDNTLQKWLFTRDMRMTRTEMKREMKEAYGDPQIRIARKQQRRNGLPGEGGAASGFLKTRVPTIIICADENIAVALRFVPGETPAPIVVEQVTGQRAQLTIRDATASGIPIEKDADLARDLFSAAKLDSFVPDNVFHRVAKAMEVAKDRRRDLG